MKHTQEKWKVFGEKNNIIITAKFLNGTDSYEMPIAYMQTEANCPETMANAQFIVKACDLHDELLEACNKALDTFCSTSYATTKVETITRKAFFEDAMNTIVILKNAINKVEGK